MGFPMCQTCRVSYRHVQWGFITIPVVLLFAFVLAPMVGDADEVGAAFVAATILFVIALVGVVAWFSRLVVTVEDGKLVAAFGTGKPHRSVDLEDVRDIRVVRNRWWYGWGVRKIPHGWMYNVWGLDAVEVERFDGSVLRVGTNDKEQLAAVLILTPRT